MTAAACQAPAAQSTGSHGTPDPGATLRVAYYRAAPTLDPHSTPTTADEPLLWPVYDRLIHANEKGEAEPGLATSWKFTSEGLELTLRKGVTFHDGTAFNAEAVKANIERAKSLASSAVKADLDSVTEAEVIDSSHVLLRTKVTDVALPLILSARAGAMISPKAFSRSDLAQRPAGTGPYKVASLNAGVSITYERYDNYWQKSSSRPARIELKVITDAATRLNALKAGQVDVANIDPNQVSEAKALPNLRVAVAKDVKVTDLQVNPAHVPAMADVRVRRAVNFAIDRKAIVDGVLFGQGEPTVQPFPQGYFAHNDAVDDAYPHDSEKATSLLREAGYGKGFTFTVLLGGSPSVSEAEALQGQLAEVGITMRIERVQGNKGVERFWRDKSAAALLVPWGGRPDPSVTIKSWFASNGVSNPGNVTSDTVTRLLGRSATERDEDTRAKLLQELSAELVNHPLSVIPLYHPFTAYGHSSRVSSPPLPMTGGIEFQDITVSK
ncbi:ABC transporter substrate-binding protein [Streptomyces sp. NPDC057580]|uniref:ABC transporter substrate-binding protein n=1 Tax=Streptomyces sp. NPDC057580 TaxID=3346173 RepID=UPI00368D209B